MGGGQKRGRTQRKHFKQNRDNVWKKTRPDPSSNGDADADADADANANANAPPWEAFATQNPAFDEYYKEQGIVPEDEWEIFLITLRKALPAAFRINSSGQFFQDIRSQLENDFMKSLEAEGTDENELDAIRPLPWYPENLAWHLNFSRMQLRKNQSLEGFHEFLKLENEIGNITRQEAVSMVPPLFLDVCSDHYVLDMCAAPGSKTFQLLEIIHQSSQPGLLPDGMIIANDVDVQRCNLLIHQTKRMCSANLIVTNHEAQHFPSCYLNMSNIRSVSAGSMASSQAYVGPKETGKSPLLFDRVLCDVPCSGDGTLRKAPDIWRKWNAGMGNGVHRLQLQIAMRGISLLKVGGRMVYSTCSMNPVENEAVVAEVLRRCGGSVELLDVSAELPQLVRRPGLKKWKVRGRGFWLASYRDFPSYKKYGILPSMFPSGQSCEVEKSVSVAVQDDIGKSDNDNGIGSLSSLGKGHQNGGDVDFDHCVVHLENTEPPTDVAVHVIEMEEPPNPCVAPMDSDVDCEAEVSDLPLEHCMRILPHDQNTGAFFIAVLHKISPLHAVPENPRSFHKNSTQTRQDLPEKSSNNMIVDKCSSETNPSEDAPDHNHSHPSEAASDTDLLDEQSSDVPMAVASQVISHETCVKNNGLMESKSFDGGESGQKRVEGGKRRSWIQGRWKGVDPVVFFRDEATINSIRSFYGISELFPFDGHLVTRNSDAHHVKRIYYISKSVCGILERNFHSGQQLKITSLGLKIFERQTSKEGSSPCAFRISSEGLPLLLPYISKQILCASITDFEHLLRYRSIKFADFVDPGFGEKVSNLLVGCCILVLNKEGPPMSDAIEVDTSTIAIGCWKGRTNLALMVSQMDSQQLLERLCVRLGREKGVPVPENEQAIVEPDAKEEAGKDTESNENCETAKESALA